MARRQAKLSKRDVDLLFKVGVLRDFVAANGWEAVKRDVVVSGVSLFNFVSNHRARYKRDTISDLAVRSLEAIPGWVWDVRRDRYQRTLDELRRHVWLRGWDFSAGDADTERLRQWVANRRAENRRGELEPRVRTALEAIPGWSWEPREDQFDTWIRSLRSHVARHGWATLEKDTRDESGAALGNWVSWVRYQYHRDALPDWVLLELARIDGWTWTPIEDQQRAKLELLREFIATHGWNAFRTSLVIDGIPVGMWVHTCLSRRRRGELAAWLIEELEAIPGWTWEPRDDAYRAWLQALRDHAERHGLESIPRNTRGASGGALGSWVNTVRQLHRRGKLASWVIAELEAIDGWAWRPHDASHRRKLALLRAFIERAGWDAYHWKLEIGGEKIGAWVNRCRACQRRGDLPAWLHKEFEAIKGWRWR